MVGIGVYSYLLDAIASIDITAVVTLTAVIHMNRSVDSRVFSIIPFFFLQQGQTYRGGGS